MDAPDIPAAGAALISEAVRREDDWQWEAALEAWDEARSAAAADDRLLGECESGRARALFALDRVSEADDADRAAAEHFAAAGEPALARLCEAALARRIGMAGRIDEALPLAEQARDAIDGLHDDPQAVISGARARQIVARLLFAAGRPDEGERQYLEARDRFADAGDDRRLARCDAALALDLLGAGRFEDAEGRAEAAVAGLTMLERAVDAAQLQLVLGRLEAEGERHEDALANFRAAQEVFRARELWPAAAEAIHLEALVLSATGEPDQALSRLGEAIGVAQRAGMDGGEGVSRLERAMVLGRLGRLDEAEAEFARAGDALVRAGDGLGAAQATYGLGSTRRAAGDPDGALESFTSAVEAFGELGAPGAQAQVLFDGGGLLAQLGRTDEALTWFDQAAAGFAADGEPLHVALVRRTWGATAGFASRPDGLDALSEARAVFAEHGATWDVAECDGMTAQVLAALGRHDDAVAAADASLAGFRSVGDGIAAVVAETMLGQLLAGGGRMGEAVAHLERAISGAVEEGAEPLAGPAHEALAGVLDDLGRAPEATLHRAAAQRLAAAAEQPARES